MVVGGYVYPPSPCCRYGYWDCHRLANTQASLLCIATSALLPFTDRAQEAEEAYLSALSHKPDHINANTNMGHLCRLQSRWQAARRYFRRALQRRPRLPTLHYYVGVVSEELGTRQDIEVGTYVHTYTSEYEEG